MNSKEIPQSQSVVNEEGRGVEDEAITIINLPVTPMKIVRVTKMDSVPDHLDVLHRRIGRGCLGLRIRNSSRLRSIIARNASARLLRDINGIDPPWEERAKLRYEKFPEPQ
jgi:hypothetical protein